MKTHLDADMFQRSHQEVRSSHPVLDSTEGVLYHLLAQYHSVKVFLQPALHGFENSIMHSAVYAPFFSSGTLSLPLLASKG